MGVNDGAETTETSGAANLSIQLRVETLVHAYQCKDATCPFSNCLKMKKMIRHKKICLRRSGDDCPLCNDVSELRTYHVTHCQEIKKRYSVPFCFNLKSKLRRPRIRKERSLDKLSKRVAGMNLRSTNGATKVVKQSRTGQQPAVGRCVVSTSQQVPKVVSSGTNHNQRVATARKMTDAITTAAEIEEFIRNHDLLTARPVPATKEWQKLFIIELRNHMVMKFAKTLYPAADSQALSYKDLCNVFAYVRLVEGNIFEQADSKSEYYHLLVAKLHSVQKEFEKKRQKRKKQQLAQQQQHSVTQNSANQQQKELAQKEQESKIAQ